MGSVPALTDLKKVDNPEEFMRFGSAAIQAIADVLNGQVEFGTNIRAQLLSFYSSTANGDIALKHNLNKTSVYYFLVSQSAAFNLYNGARANTPDTLYIRANAAGVSGTILAF